MLHWGRLRGSFRFLLLYDVGEAIRLEEVRRILGSPAPGRGPSFRHLAPDYVRFEDPPVVEPLEPFVLESGEVLAARAHYYAFGVVSLELEYPFELHWAELKALSNRWISSAEVERQAGAAVSKLLAPIQAAIVKPYDSRLSEDYYIIYVEPVPGIGAAELLNRHGRDIAEALRGELTPLAEEEVSEVLQGRLSYYPNDLLVVTWAASFIYDTREGALPAIQLLTYANVQLLELRHYDDLLTRVLAGVYERLEARPGLLRRWRLASEAERLNTIRLDVRELTERLDTAIKFLSDMYSARLFRLAAAKVGVPDYQRLVDDKLQTAAELYHSMVEQYNHARAFILESMIVIILIIDLIFLFKGK